MSVAGRKVTLTFCEICKCDVKYFNRHLAKNHSEISQIEYFNTYKRTSDKQGFCKTCGKPTTFYDANKGFAIYCNAKCQMLNSDMQRKYRDAYKAKTGYEHNFQNPECIAKIKQSQTEKYGGIGFASNEIRKKILNGIDNCMHIPEVVEKVKQTRLANNNGKWCSDKQLAAIHNANLNREKYDKAVATKYLNNNGQYESTATKLKRSALAKTHYDKFVKILNFSYQNECTCKCLACNNVFTENYSTIRTRILANINPCTNCVPLNAHVSNAEKQLADYVKSICKTEIIENDRAILNGKELDLYLPEYKLAFEYNGLYWHNELHKAANYHLQKTEMCEKQGIQLIHIFEDEWLYKQDIVKSRIKGLLHLNDRIFARKCVIKQVSATDSDSFLNTNHTQGACISKYRYGLYYNEELVSLMTFGKSRFTNEIELLRFCNKLNTNVIGAASKLLKHFLKDTAIAKIISYADRRWSCGRVYDKLGFTLLGKSIPSYYYVVDNMRQNRINYQKHKLVLEGFDDTKTEHQIMLERSIYRIYDCGTLKYEYNNN